MEEEYAADSSALQHQEEVQQQESDDHVEDETEAAHPEDGLVPTAAEEAAGGPHATDCATAESGHVEGDMEEQEPECEEEASDNQHGTVTTTNPSRGVPGNLLNPQQYKSEMQRIDDGKYILLRTMEAMKSVHRHPDLEVNELELLQDVESEEKALFSEVPSEIVAMAERQRSLTREYNKTVASHMSMDKAAMEEHESMTVARAKSRSKGSRLIVSPEEPLLARFNMARYVAKQPERAQMHGRYHGLFFKDGEPVTFEAPADNRRRQIEERRRANQPPAAPERKPAKEFRLKTLKVSADYLPSCAMVDHSERQENLKRMRQIRESTKPAFHA